MLFNSIEFLLFFPLVTLAYFLLPHKFRWVLLLGASCLFYMAFVPIYIVILAFTIFIDYFAGIYIENSQGRTRRHFLIASLLSNIGILAIFKYYNFFVANINTAAGHLGLAGAVPLLSILLPIGLSFHTFQAMAYTIEVYRQKQPAERHFGIYALYVMFYPQLVAGPIERPQNLIHQFHEKHEFNYCEAAEGLRLMLWGLFKKVVIADRLAPIVNAAYKTPDSHSALVLLIATYCFAVQIYCDFSGYSDMAIGAARIMGFKLMINFERPYFATSIQEFWRRWHISLSTWFKDYLYVPLGGSRNGSLRTAVNVLAVFLLSGFWHGANWTFIIWGGLHAIFFWLSSLISALKKKFAPKDFRFPGEAFLGWLLTFNLVAFAWIFFRAPDVNQALLIAGKIYEQALPQLMAAFQGSPQFALEIRQLGIPPAELCITALVLTLFVLLECAQEWAHVGLKFPQFPFAVRWLCYYSACFLIVFFGGLAEPFIYFQF